MQNEKVVLITGAAKRVGAVIARNLHHSGFKTIIHYGTSKQEAHVLQDELNKLRPNSAACLQADLLDTKNLTALIEKAVQTWGRLDVLINSASTFYATSLGTITEDNWHDLMGTNLKAPLFLSQAAAPHIAKHQGCIINIVDIHAKQPLKDYIVYTIAKAGLAMLTKVLAKELGPKIRVNGIAPGAVLWPTDQNAIEASLQDKIINRTALKRSGTPEDVAKTINFLVTNAEYITGQIIAVDGGRSLEF